MKTKLKVLRNHITGPTLDYPMTEAEALKDALKLSRGYYQENILTGRQRVSGSDLLGEAKKWSAGYARSRRNLLYRLERAGIPYEIKTEKNGLKVLVLGEE